MRSLSSKKLKNYTRTHCGGDFNLSLRLFLFTLGMSVNFY
jgi:hypothetical protein